METLKLILTIIFVLVCVALSVIILMQDGKDAGLGALAGGSGGSNTYLDKNKGRTKSGKLVKYTRLLAVLFLLLAAILNFNFDRTEQKENTTVAPTESVSTTESVNNTEAPVVSEVPAE